MSATRCPACGRFARYDAYYVRFRCDYCDREVLPSSKTPPLDMDTLQKLGTLAPARSAAANALMVWAAAFRATQEQETQK